jgi:hypothetical protein
LLAPSSLVAFVQLLLELTLRLALYLLPSLLVLSWQQFSLALFLQKLLTQEIFHADDEQQVLQLLMTLTLHIRQLLQVWR